MADDSSASTWIFSGYVTPEHAILTLPAMSISARLAHTEKFRTSFKVDCGSVLGTVCVPKEFDQSLIPMVVRQHVQQRIDMHGFAEGEAYDFRVKTYAPYDRPDLAQTLTCKSSALGVDTESIDRRRALTHKLRKIGIVGSESRAMRSALADLRLAILEPAHAPYFAYRVAESIRQYFVKGDEHPRNDSWSEMHAALKTSKNDLQVFSALATAIRHGELRDIDDETGQQYLRIASEFIEAFASLIIEKHHGVERFPNL